MRLAMLAVAVVGVMVALPLPLRAQQVDPQPEVPAAPIAKPQALPLSLIHI